MPVPLGVYLDSADYSVLSDSRRHTPELNAIRDKLVMWANSGEVEFWYSATHISEMSPLSVTHVTDANERADLLVTLCGKKALVSFDKLVARELHRLRAKEAEAASVFSTTGDWFPDVGDIVPTFNWDSQIKSIEADFKDRGCNRAMRRQMMKKTFKDKKPTAGTKKMFAENAAKTNHEFLQKYPMRPQDAHTLTQYFLGKASHKDAEEAFLASLRDPRWMMRWFAENGDLLSPIIELVRGPSKNMHARLKENAERVIELRLSSPHFSEQVVANEITGTSARKRMRTALLESLSDKLSKSFGIETDTALVAEIEKFSPGFTTCVSVVVQSSMNSLSETPRKPLESDFVDALHAMYAPYVDVFRTDSYMAPIVANAVKPYDTTVVGKLKQLVPVIEQRLGVSRQTLASA